MERAEERVGVFVAQEIRGFVELERRMQQVVARELAARLLDELLERRAVLREPALQRPRAQAELARHFVDRRPPPGQLPLQDALDLLADRSRGERLGELGLELRRRGPRRARCCG